MRGVVMFTRFQTESGEHVMEQSGPRVRLRPPEASPGWQFLATIGSAYGSEKAVTRDELLEGAKHLADVIERDRQLLPYRYSLEIRMMGRDDMKTRGTGTVSFPANGRVCRITGGVGECIFEEWVQAPDGTGHVVKPVDVRDKRRIASDWGDVKISRRKVESTLPDELASLIRFLEAAPDAAVRVYSYDKTPTLTDILREAAEGSGGDYWAGEELSRLGESGKRQLLEALGQSRYRKHRGTIIGLLFTVFPSRDTREAVESFIAQQPEGRAKTEYLALFAAFAAASAQFE
jgi:hypothetical protein